MARTVSQIKENLKSALVAFAASIGITIDPSIWSKSDYKDLVCEMLASQQAIEEQLYDDFQSRIESAISIAAPQTAQWIRDRMINLFEYDATSTPIVKLKIPELYPYYPSPVPAFRLIKYCSVTSGIYGTVDIKIAGDSGSPMMLSSPIVSAAQSFVNIITQDGINYNVASYDTDYLYCGATIYYTGIYSAVISTNVKAAISLYLKSIPFDGQVSLDDLLIAIKSVTGVVRIIFNNVYARRNTVSFGSGINMVSSNSWINDIYQTYAGYISPEIVPNDLDTSLTFIAI
jgi:hypothetical protein